MVILRIQVVHQAGQPAFHANREHEQEYHHDREDQHHDPLGRVSENVRMGTAHHDVDRQHSGGHDQRPHLRHAEHDLEHHEPGHELPDDVEEQHQRQQGDDDTDAVGLIAVTQVLRNGPIAESIPRRRDETHGNEDAEVNPDGIQEVAPDGRRAEFVGEARPAQKRRATGRGGGESEGKHPGTVGAACRRKVVGMLDAPLADHADREHGARVEREKEPGPGDQGH